MLSDVRRALSSEKQIFENHEILDQKTCTNSQNNKGWIDSLFSTFPNFADNHCLPFTDKSNIFPSTTHHCQLAYA